MNEQERHRLRMQQIASEVIGTKAADVGVFDRMVPLPSVDLVHALQSAVVRSVDEDESAAVALEKLQNRVLMAVARFECAMVIT